MSAMRAAIYLRMSTEHQQYSTANQEDKIREYAEKRQIDIVRVFTDEGRSGLRIEGRDGLKRLIKEVQSGQADFNVILVYDVSRWGRFQDADESAYYEYVCRNAGIQVAYCAEQFENDGSPISTIVKAVKRTMAGEYSRELSSKVFAGQCRLIELGFRQGGPAGYGLRRVLVDQAGSTKHVLRRGEHKSLQTDRVILVPGPEDEIAVVQRIYRWFVDDGANEAAIAMRLSSEEIASESGRPWTRAVVHEVLTNEKYIGSNVYNRVSFKLKKLRVVNDRDLWVRKEDAFEGIVSKELFFTAQGIIRARSIRLTDEQLLERLRALYGQKGYLSALIINESETMPSSVVYANRFGSLYRAYQIVGYEPGRDFEYIEINRRLRQMHPTVVAETEAQLSAAGGSIRCDPVTQLLRVNDEFGVSLVLARCQRTPEGVRTWKIRFDTALMPDITIAVRLDTDNCKALDYYLLPSIDMASPKLQIREHNQAAIESYRFDTLEYFYGMASRSRVRRVA
jgi:DNA invertase Pin-like site-specific DNA recombinase